MDVGAISEQVLVSSDVPVIETATISVGTVINQRTVQEIPLNGRHFRGSRTTDSGFSDATAKRLSDGAACAARARLPFNTAGNREDTVNFMINGVNLNDMVQNQITFQPSINTVQEFKADNSTFSAEYGRNSGAIVNIATRSGTNDYHGEFFEFLRNDMLDARNFFDAIASRLSSATSLASTRWPVNLPHFGEGGSPFSYNGKNKTFFFFSYEGLRQRQGLTLTSNVFTPATTCVGDELPTVIKLLPLIPRRRALTLWQSPTQVAGSGTAPVNIDQWTGDVSHNFGANDRLHGYYAFPARQARRAKPSGQHASGFWRYTSIASTDLHAQRDTYLWS
jgi:hypothetical protein